MININIIDIRELRRKRKQIKQKENDTQVYLYSRCDKCLELNIILADKIADTYVSLEQCTECKSYLKSYLYELPKCDLDYYGLE